MFTSEPSLSQRIERKIRETPVVDTHSFIRFDRPNASDLAALIADRWIKAELIAVGMPDQDFDGALPADERVRRALPHLPRIRNTAASWCLFRIFRELHDFYDPALTEANYRDLFDKVAATASASDWADTVLRGKCNFKTIVVSDADGAEAPDWAARRLDLIDPSLHDRIADETADKVKFVNAYVGSGALSGLYPLLDRVQDRSGSIQLTLGGDFPVANLAELPRLFGRFDRVRFDLLPRSERVARELLPLAARLTNVYVSGLGGASFAPPEVQARVALSLQIAPVVKWSGFVSGSDTVEWTYGRYQAVKKAIARAFASLIEAGCYEEDEAPALLRQVLHDTPSDLHGLG